MSKGKALGITSHTCQMCGKQWTRREHRGQQPKWCSQRCADLGKYGARRTCARCGVAYFGVGKSYCSRECARAIRPAGDGPDMKAAYDKRDWDALLRIIEDASTPDTHGCWLWQGRLDKYGYAVARRRNGTVGVHRVALEAKCRAPLGSQAAHHVCAVKACVNPDHLEPVTHAANVGEMLARKSYVRRIRDLEAALAASDPHHPLLTTIPVA